jgi:hypothetical protein
METNGMESSKDKLLESNLVLLLQLIHAEADVDALLKRGLQYSQIADLLFYAKEDNLVSESETRLELTAFGLDRIKNSKTLSNIKGIWISTLDELRIPSIEIDEVYLPSAETKNDIENLTLRQNY